MLDGSLIILGFKIKARNFFDYYLINLRMIYEVS